MDTSLSIDYDLATPVGLFRFHPLLFFLTDPRSSDSGHILMSYAPLDQGSVLVANGRNFGLQPSIHAISITTQNIVRLSADALY